MNAADERSLESIRQKVFPFLSLDWRTDEETAPRFLILDECETLTEAAQLSLQTILNTDPRQICVILICNSQSRIHPKLRQRLLKIRYDPPNRYQDSTTLFTAITRGDLRLVERKKDTEQRIWNYIHAHPSQLRDLIRESNMDHQMILSELLLLADMLQILDTDLLEKINTIYPFITDTTYLHLQTEDQMIQLIREFKDKIERRCHVENAK
jgi:DNA polymerase III delta prime subunit